MKEIEKFDGKIDFNMWQEQVEDERGIERCRDSRGKTETMKEKDYWGRLDEEACFTIRSYLSEEKIARIVETEKSPDEIWEKLEKLYSPEKMLTKRLNLKNQFYRLTMDGNTTIQDHLNKFRGILGELSDLDVEISEEDKVMVFLKSLPYKYNQWAATVLKRKQSAVLDEVTSVLLYNENYWKDLDPQNHAGLLIIPDYFS